VYRAIPATAGLQAFGIVRGLLCSQCNQGLGRFKDSVELLKNAIAYLQSEPITLRGKSFHATGAQTRLYTKREPHPIQVHLAQTISDLRMGKTRTDLAKELNLTITEVTRIETPTRIDQNLLHMLKALDHYGVGVFIDQQGHLRLVNFNHEDDIA